MVQGACAIIHLDGMLCSHASLNTFDKGRRRARATAETVLSETGVSIFSTLPGIRAFQSRAECPAQGDLKILMPISASPNDAFGDVP